MPAGATERTDGRGDEGMARSPVEGLKVVAANRLDTGAVVWLGGDGAWGALVGGAAVYEGAEADAALGRAKLAEGANVVVDPTLIDVTLEDGLPVPLRPRERVRALGPSVRTDLGVQAGQFL